MNELANQNDVLAVATQTDTMLSLAGSLVKSGLIPNAIKSPEAALGVLLKGRELGLAPMQSFDSIDVIQGKPTLKPQAMLALIYSSNNFGSFQVDSSDSRAATVTMSRRGSDPHSETFTMDDAKTLGLAGKDNWKKQPATMLKWRAVSACARVVFPDVIQGMYTPEEIGQDTEQVEVAFVDEEPDRVPLSSPDPPREETLDKALASRLHRALGGMGLSHGQQQLLATAIAKRRIESFTELTIMESKSVHAAGSTLADGSASPTDYNIPDLAWDEGPIGVDEALEELPA